jgi:hypothetical protein
MKGRLERKETGRADLSGGIRGRLRAPRPGGAGGRCWATCRAAGVARSARVPVVGAGGIATPDDRMGFLVAGAAGQLGTVHFYDPGAARVADGLPTALGAGPVSEVVGRCGGRGRTEMLSRRGRLR